MSSIVPDTRNRSVLAHGYQPIAEQDTAQLRDRAPHVLAAVWHPHGTDADFRTFCDRPRFIDTDR